MKNFMYINSIIISIIILTSCGNEINNENDTSDQVLNSNQVALTSNQINNAEIEVGQFSIDTVAEIVNTNGIIKLPPNDHVSINALYECFIDEVYYMEGQNVKEGDILVALKHPNFIQIQQEYLQAKSQYSFLQKELERQQLLSDSNVTAKKKLQQTQADMTNVEALTNSLAEKLKLIGINPEKVLQGNIQSIVYLRSPISGVVTKVTGFRGQSILPQQAIMEVINNKAAYLELNIFEKNIGKVEPLQKLNFKVSSIINSPTYQAEVSSVGGSLDLDTRTIKVIAHFDPNPILIPGLYVEAEIFSKPACVSTLPEEAIIFGQDDTFIFIKSPVGKGASDQDEVIFTKVKVETGRSSNGRVEIIPNELIDANSQIVIKGVNYLKSEMGKGEENE